MKNAIHEKTKLEGERAVAEKKISRLQGQNSLLERDIHKRESLGGRRLDSVMERGPKVSVPKNALAAGTSFEQTMQEDYQKLEVLLFEMEATIASLEEQVREANKDRDEALCKNEGLMLEIDVLLKASSAELNALREEVSGLRLKLEESISEQKRSEDFIKSLSEEKEELALQLADALLEIEEERTIWSAKETGSISAINEQAKLHKSEITSLFEKMSEVKHQFESCKEECNALRERVEDNEKCARGKKCRVETFTEIDQVMENQGRLDDTSNEYKQLWEAKIQVEELNRRISAMEAKMHEADIINGKVKAKLRMRLKGTQAKLDTFRLRHNEVVDETAFMNKKFEDASEKLKGMVASLGKECLNLKKQLAACRCHSSS